MLETGGVDTGIGGPGGVIKTYFYETCCVHADGDDIQDMVDASRETKYRHLLHACYAFQGWAAAMGYVSGNMGSAPGLRLCNDHHVTYHFSVYQGRRCFYLVHSGVEFVWTRAPGLHRAPRNPAPWLTGVEPPWPGAWALRGP